MREGKKDWKWGGLGREWKESERERGTEDG